MPRIKNQEIFVKNDNNKWTINLSKSFYEKAAIFAAAYKLNRFATIQIEPKGENEVLVTFSGIKSLEYGVTGQQLVEEFCREVNDQQLRQELNRQFGRLRDLIVEQAFKPVANLEDKINGKD
ncbi:His-Xaa-Ser system protein HxsD [Geothermobacter ehrlichii]|uniref:His-Xaa-Ser system protein HxsD n=1 Tax=Geothermobacter ehrlichii TaxID=213224 RepID=A0A5D3WHC4_9BACT|nr:His-Xaa-Ser system protein HxsD [Geothermobacter ehrlichii]TYO96722.1 His-Xaa-Ser system protein HxsD [Geothermobacter ehrlichii]